MRNGTKTSGLVAIAALTSVGIAAPAFAADSISVGVPAKTLANKLTADTNVSSAPIPVSLNAGQYTVVMGSLDDAHPNQVDQPNERWYAVFYGANGAIVGTTSTTPDLALADISREWDAAPLSLTANATSVVYFHAPGTGTDSVYPNVLRLTPFVVGPTVPETTTTTTIATPVTTTPVATVPETVPETTTPVAPAEPTAYIPVVAVTPTTNTTAAAATAAPAPAPTPAPATTVAPAPVTSAPVVEVKGLQISNVAPVASAPTATPEIAFTGTTSKPLLATALGFVGLGSALLFALRRRNVQ
jgi:hypothetical protein